MTTDNKYLEFQEFQKNFFTDFNRFKNYSNFEIRKHGFILLNNIAKGFPSLINTIINLKGFGFEGFNSPEIFIAIQHLLRNPYIGGKIPQYIFYKTPKKDKIKAVKISNNLYNFSDEIKSLICQSLLIDSKDYEYLKYTERIQKCGRSISGNIKE